jgi:putative Mn2+ efflux pump MntP
MSWWEAILMAVSLCADCFAVTLCSSTTLKRVRWSQTAVIAIVFAVIQTGLLALGWLLGSLVAHFVIRASHIIGFLLLLYVGGSMLFEGIRGKDESRDLNGLWNIIIGGVATSIDALAVGTSQSIEGLPWEGFLPLAVSVFAVTALSAVLGICGGKVLGTKIGRLAEILGGLVLIGIGVSFLF